MKPLRVFQIGLKIIGSNGRWYQFVTIVDRDEKP